jgi:hypothetical protein
MNNKRINRTGQIWTIDYIIGLLLFIAVLLSVLVIMKGYLGERDTYKETVREADHIASILLSEELTNISESNLSTLVIAKNNRINTTKLLDFDDITYSQQKTLLQNSGEFLFYFYNGTIINETVCFRGYPLEGCELAIPQSAVNVAKTERLVILNSKIVKMIVITWI